MKNKSIYTQLVVYVRWIIFFYPLLTHTAIKVPNIYIYVNVYMYVNCKLMRVNFFQVVVVVFPIIVNIFLFHTFLGNVFLPTLYIKNIFNFKKIPPNKLVDTVYLLDKFGIGTVVYE